jgi:hypothetical protein
MNFEMKKYLIVPQKKEKMYLYTIEPGSEVFVERLPSFPKLLINTENDKITDLPFPLEIKMLILEHLWNLWLSYSPQRLEIIKLITINKTFFKKRVEELIGENNLSFEQQLEYITEVFKKLQNIGFSLLQSVHRSNYIEYRTSCISTLLKKVQPGSNYLDSEMIFFDELLMPYPDDKIDMWFYKARKFETSVLVIGDQRKGMWGNVLCLATPVVFIKNEIASYDLKTWELFENFCKKIFGKKFKFCFVFSDPDFDNKLIIDWIIGLEEIFE